MGKNAEGRRRDEGIHTAITLISVRLKLPLALGNLQIILGHNGIEGGFAAGHEFAGVAMTKVAEGKTPSEYICFADRLLGKRGTRTTRRARGLES